MAIFVMRNVFVGWVEWNEKREEKEEKENFPNRHFLHLNTPYSANRRGYFQSNKLIMPLMQR